MIKIVYVFVGTEKKEYLNMLRISVSSVRKHMETIPVVILTDADTATVLNSSGFFADENTAVTPVDIPQRYNTVEKSRYLKTNMRELVEGDFLYIDCDTIVCADLSDICASSSVSMVLDEHGFLHEQEDSGAAVKRAAKERGIDLDDCVAYFNGGVILAKDDDTARLFFKKWYELWDRTKKVKMHHDQFSLNAVNMEMNVIRELDGTYNCQMTANYRAFFYLRNVKILHYLSAQENGIYKLNDLDFLQKDLTNEEIDAVIKAPEKAFVPFHFYSDTSVEYRLMQSSHFHLTQRLYQRHRGLYNFGEKVLRKMRK